jgi:hypothetical protein
VGQIHLGHFRIAGDISAIEARCPCPSDTRTTSWCSSPGPEEQARDEKEALAAYLGRELKLVLSPEKARITALSEGLPFPRPSRPAPLERPMGPTGPGSRSRRTGSKTSATASSS